MPNWNLSCVMRKYGIETLIFDVQYGTWNKSGPLYVVCSCYYACVFVDLYLMKYAISFSGVGNSVIFNKSSQHLH